MTIHYDHGLAGFAGGAMAIMSIPVGGLISIATHGLYKRLRRDPVATAFLLSMTVVTLGGSYMVMYYLARH